MLCFRYSLALWSAGWYNDSRRSLYNSANLTEGRVGMSEEVTMGSMNPQQVEREAHRAQANRDELVERIARAIREDGTVEPLKGLHLHRSSSPTESVHGVSDPAFCVIAQGSKEVLLGDNRYRYDSAHYLLATVELPVVSQVIEASPQWPYLSLRLELDPTLVGSVMVEAGHVRLAAKPCRREGHGRKPVGCKPAGRHSAAHQAPGHPCRSSDPRAADHAGNCLQAADGSTE